jgi:hypothetical protein
LYQINWADHHFGEEGRREGGKEGRRGRKVYI